MNQVFDSYYRSKMPCSWINKSVGVPLQTDLQLECDLPISHYIPANLLLHWDNVNRHLSKTADDHLPPIVPINLINLDERVDRLAEWCYHWKNATHIGPFPVERVSAIKMKPGWIGCALSQLKCVERAKIRGDPYCIIMEDDCVATVSHDVFAQRFGQIMLWLHRHMTSWEVFNFMPASLIENSPMQPIEDTPGIWVTNGGVNHHLIVINASMYDRLLQLVSFYTRADAEQHRGALCIDEITNRHSVMMTSYPFLVSTFSNCSDIDPYAMVNAKQKIQQLRDVKKNLPIFDASQITIAITAGYRPTNLRRTLWSLQGLLNCGASIVINEDPDHLTNLKQLYNKVKTEYVLHCEDDWTFTDDLIDCLKVSLDLLGDPKIGQVWLRDPNDLMGHPITQAKVNGYHVLIPVPGEAGHPGYNGFTLNPSLLETKTMLERLGDIDKDMDRDSVSLEIELNKGWGENIGTVCLPTGCVWHNGEISTKNAIIKDPDYPFKIATMYN